MNGELEAGGAGGGGGGELERILESLLFLSADPVGVAALADAVEAEPDEVTEALARLEAAYEAGGRGLVLRRLAGGYALSSHPDAELAARRLLARPRTPPLTSAQAETLAIVAYLQPVSRPEIARLRGVSAESAATTLLERGLVEESGRSQFGAVLYRTTDLFLKLFGLGELSELPEIAGFDPGPEFEQQLRERLLQAGEVRSGAAVTAAGAQSLRDDNGSVLDADEPPEDGGESASAGESGSVAERAPADEPAPGGEPGPADEAAPADEPAPGGEPAADMSPATFAGPDETS
jgi:segregation and condensation protein B